MCTNLLEYGTEYPSQSEKVKNKTKQSNLKKYGVEYTFQSEEVKDKIKQTNLERCGYEFASQSPRFKEKVKQTNSKKPKKQKIKKPKPICKISHEEKQKIALEKRKNTNRQRFGYDFASQSPEVKEKTKQNNLKKYGVDNPAKSDTIKQKVRKYFENKYGKGITNPGMAPETREKVSEYYENKYGEGITSYFQTDEFKEKSRQTRIKNFGQDVNSPFQIKEVQEKIKQTNLDKYGADNPWKSKQIINKIENTKLDKYGNSKYNNRKKMKKTKKENLSRFAKEHDCTQLKDLNLDYSYRIAKSLDTIEFKSCLFIKNSDIELAKELDKKYRDDAKEYNSRYEAEIHEWLKAIYSSEILVNIFSIIKDDTKKQLDFYIPDKQLAIEFNGDYIHSINFGKDKNYHLNKMQLCQDKGIRLIHIFEHEWNAKRDICKSIILSTLNIYEKTIYARKCEVKEVSSEEAKYFLSKNHLQGIVASNYRIGLYYNDELVQLLCFGKNRFKNNEIELLRMCTKLNTQVIGGFSKLLKYQPYNDFVSYIDLSKFTASSYLKNGFSILNQSAPNYKYIKGERVLNRIQAQKHKLPKLLGDKFDESKTESQNMIDNGWWKVYDCGNLKLEFTKQ